MRQQSGRNRSRLNAKRTYILRLFSALLSAAFSALLIGDRVEAGAPVMVLPGQFHVSDSGAATYSVPIVVPPGTSGMVPGLSLDYSSGGSNGIVGLGWSLGGFFSIEHCAQTIDTDSARGSVQYNANDRFCLNGQRLIVITGTYGADGSEYRTEIEGFFKVIAHGSAGTGPAWFEVHTKAGQIMELGNTTNSRVLALGSATPRSWAVDKITDTKGNYLTVTYVNDTTNGQVYPSRIDYTGNAAASLSPYNSVQFVYNTNRPDQIPAYRAGSLINTTVLLTNVKTYKGTTLVSDYQLTYQSGDNIQPSKLTSVRVCYGAGPLCLPATSFTWSGGTTSYSLKATPNWGGNNPIPGDYAGTGRDGLLLQGRASGAATTLYLSDQTGALSATGFSQAGWDATTLNGLGICTGDWNGDGKLDVALGNTTYKSTGTGFVQLTSSTSASCFSQAPADFNGDGYADAFHVIPPESCSSWTTVGDGAGNFSLFAYPSGCFNPALGDFNGDGLTDVIISSFNQPYTSVELSTGTTLSNIGSPVWGNSMNQPLIAGDFNGDGVTDIIVLNSGIATLYLSKGDGTFVSTGWASPSSWANAQVADVNGDGRMDVIVGTSGSAPTVYLSTGTGFVASGSMGLPPLTFDSLIVADFNGDGAPDVMVQSNTAGAATPEYVSTYTPQLITAINSGIGATTTITYKPLTDPSVYTEGTGAAYPFLDIGGASYVVSRVDAANGVGGIYSSAYTYSTARLERNGRGFLGFGETKVLDLQTNILQTTDYRQDFPYIGLVATQTKTLGSQTLDTKTNTYATTNFGGARNFPYLSQSVEAANDLDGSALPTVTSTYQYDAYGNATQIVVSTPDGASKTTTNTYTNDTTHWFLGLLTNTAVTSNFPHTAAGSTNQRPHAVNDNVSTHAGTAVTFDPRTNDSDPDGDPLTISSTGTAAHGTVQILSSGTQLKYTPTAGYVGTDSFTYSISDGVGGVASATVNVTVGNTAPVAVNDSKSTHSGTAISFDPRGNDSDADGDPLTITAKTNGAHGTVAITGNGTGVTFTPATGYTGTDSFTYTIADGLGGTATATVTMTMTNTVPVAANDNLSALLNTAASIDPRTNDSDADNDPLTITAKTDGTHGTVAITGGGTGVTYTPANGYTGTDSFTYTIADGNGGTATGTVSVTVAAANPTITTSSLPNGSAGAAYSQTLAATDPNNYSITWSVTVGSLPAGLSLTGSTGAIAGTPTTAGTASFTVQASNGHGGTATKALSITIAAANSAPTANNDSKTVNQESGANTVNVLANDTDPDSDTLTITAVTQGTNGAVAIASGGGSVTYTPATRVWGTDSFTYTISDGHGHTATATVNVTITQVDETVTTGVTTGSYGTLGPNYRSSTSCTFYGCSYSIIDTRTSAIVFGAGWPPLCNNAYGWAAGFWVSGCNFYKDLTPLQ